MFSGSSLYLQRAPRYGKATYAQIGGPDGLLANLEEFSGNTLWSEWLDDNHYAVYSYETVIGLYNKRLNKVFFDRSKFSQTTSRHQSLVTAWLGYSVKDLESNLAA